MNDDKNFWIFVIGGTVAFLVCLPSIIRWWRAERDRRAAERRARRLQRFPRRVANVPAVDLVRLFGAPSTWTAGMLAPARSRVEPLTDLVLPSGTLVACDPLVFPDSPPFERTVEPGSYRVDVATVAPETGGDAYAAVRVVFAEGTPTRWESADADGYGVDAGLGCVMSVEARDLLLARMERESREHDEDYYTANLAKVLDAGWHDHHPSADAKENCVIVTSGAGDGIYPSYWGLDDDGRVLWFVTDFQVVRDANVA